MADQKISQLTTIVTVDTATDLFPIVDTSAAETKKITPSALKTALSLNNVDNTSDANKPISSATQTALDAKQATLVSGTNIKTINSTSILGSGDITISGGGGTWGSITGTLSSQTDLQTALNGKVDENTAITGATKTKITYDAKGLVTAGADATTADIADSTNKRYVTDAQLTVIGNTSGTNTGDNAVNSLYSGLATSKQDTLVSGTNIKTINSTSLLGSGDITISASPSGVAGAIQFSNGSAFASDAANLFWDDTNNRLGIGTNAPSATAHFKGSGSTSATTSLLVQNSAGTERFKVTDNGVSTFTPASAYTVAITTGNNGVIRSAGGYENADGVYGADSGLFLRAAGNMYITANNGNTASFGLFGTGSGFNIGTGLSVDASAVLNLNSTNRGFLPPRMTTTQKNAIATPASGLVVYDTTTNKLCCYNGSTWNDLF